MRIRFLLPCLALAGCAAGSTIQEAKSTQGLGKYKVVHIEVTTDDPGNTEAVAQLKSSITGQMATLSCFENYVTGPGPGNADLRLSAMVTGVRAVSSIGRAMWGAMAGRAKVRAEITLIDIKTDEVIAAFSIEGKSSGGWVGAGTTPQAFEKAGEGVARYIILIGRFALYRLGGMELIDQILVLLCRFDLPENGGEYDQNQQGWHNTRLDYTPLA